MEATPAIDRAPPRPALRRHVHRPTRSSRRRDATSRGCRWRAGSASRARSCRSRSRSWSSPSSCRSTAPSSRRSRASCSPPTRPLVLAAFLIFYAGFPLRGLRWATLLRGTGQRVIDPGLDRDHLPVVARQLRRAGQARRRLPGLSPQDQQHGVAVADVRDRLHRARPRPVRDRASSVSPPGYWSFRSGLPPAIQLVFGIGVVVVVGAWRSGCSRCATSGARSSSRCRCRTRSSSCTTGSRRASSARSSRATCPGSG